MKHFDASSHVTDSETGAADTLMDHPGSSNSGPGPANPMRRRLLTAGSIMVSFALLPGARALAQGSKTTTTTEAGTMTSATPALPGDLKVAPMLDAWIKIDQHGHVTVFTGKAELGTGVRTAMMQVAAEQLNIKPSALTLITADTALTPNEGYTAGSHTMADSGTAILHAASQVRLLLAQSAATRWSLDPATLVLADGVIKAPDGRTMTYGDAVSGLDLHQPAQSIPLTTDARAYKVIGQPFQRVDIPGKLTGGESYVQDLRLPGMVHARVVRPPSYGATLGALDTAAVSAMPGVLAVVRNGSYLAVVAGDEWQAITAQRLLTQLAAPAWQAGKPLPAPETLFDTLMKLPARDNTPIAKGEAPASVAQTLSARYTKPYLMHGSIGPACAVASFVDGKLSVWSHTQGVFPLRKGLAEMLTLSPDDVRVVHVPGAGCYGHNGADDVAADAALIAHAVPGKPVRVQWMRDQEQTWEPFGPAMVTEVSASLDSNGMIVDWHHTIWSNGHNQRIDNAGRLMPTWSLAQPFVPSPPVPLPMPEGGGDRNSIPLYNFPSMHVLQHFLPDMPVRVSAMRSLGAYMNVFTIESFMDELARAAHADPVEFRLKHLDDPRARDVINLAAQRFGWASQPKRKPGHGIGFSFAKYKNLMAYMAMAVEIQVDHETGMVHIERVCAAVDVGQIVNPDGVRNQIEGGILQSASWTLFEQVSFDTTKITSFDWSTYPIMRFSAVPGSVDVQLINRPGEIFLGAGEGAQGPTPAALANAIVDATGQRLRSTPLAGPNLKAAVGV
jgi:nicotinate dehydrogenase subunit B